jgi:hypothetical protein
MFLLDERPLSPDVPFEHDGISYPSNWLRLASPAEREAIGITEEPDPPAYDQRFYWGYDADGALIPKQLDDETSGLKALWKQQTAQTAFTLLQPTDWYFTREADNGKPCPAPIRVWREDIRNLVQTKTSAIEDCATVEELAAFVASTNSEDPASDYSYWPSAPEVNTVEPVCDYRSFYDALLISPAYVTIRTKAITSPAVLTACVEFIAAIGDAKSGRPNPAAIQACVDLLCAAAQFTAAELTELAEVMTVGGLDQFYTLPEIEES